MYSVHSLIKRRGTWTNNDNAKCERNSHEMPYRHIVEEITNLVQRGQQRLP